MPFWKKEEKQTIPVAIVVPVSPRIRHGRLACTEDSCTRHDAITCSYVDRRGRVCPTAWCPDHQVFIGGRAFCRRHARFFFATATGEFQMVQTLPDLENRSPSLADYIGDALEPRVLGLLTSLCRSDSNDQVSGEPLRDVHLTGGESRRWNRSWKMYDHTGVIVQVAVEVDENRDPVVDFMVGRNLIGQGVPPWIERRRQGKLQLSLKEDNEEREEFYNSLFAGAQPLIIETVEQRRSSSRNAGH